MERHLPVRSCFDARGSNAEERLGTHTLFFSERWNGMKYYCYPCLFRYLTCLVFYCSAEYMGWIWDIDIYIYVDVVEQVGIYALVGQVL